MESKLSELVVEILEDIKKSPNTSKKKLDGWEKSKIIANWIAVIAIPIILGIGGFLINTSIKNKESRTKLLEIATNILSTEPKQSDFDKSLRIWAFDIIQYSSPVTMNNEIRKYLEANPLPSIVSNMNQDVGIILNQIDTKIDRNNPQEMAFGNLVTDAILESYRVFDERGKWPRADFSIISSSVIRGNRVYQPKSKITRMDILLEIPFPNHLVMLKITGTELRNLLTNALSNSFPQVSGLKIEYTIGSDQKKVIKSILVNGIALSDAFTYNFVTIEYHSLGGGFPEMKSLERIEHPSNKSALSDALMIYILTRKQVSPIVEGRIGRVD
jgi:hypothetical protein